MEEAATLCWIPSQHVKFWEIGLLPGFKHFLDFTTLELQLCIKFTKKKQTPKKLDHHFPVHIFLFISCTFGDRNLGIWSDSGDHQPNWLAGLASNQRKSPLCGFDSRKLRNCPSMNFAVEYDVKLKLLL